MPSGGAEKAWEMLANLNPDVVCSGALVSYNEAAGLYTLKSFGMDLFISVRDRKIFSQSPGSDTLLERFGYFSRLSILWYLVHAKDIPFTNTLVKPVSLKGGQLFFRGTHVLPLDRLAWRYGNDIEAFLKKGQNLKGETLQHGDASLRLYPLPRIPVVAILWKGDEEFPPRADLLFDSTCELQLPVDILWSVAMLTLLMMM